MAECKPMGAIAIKKEESEESNNATETCPQPQAAATDPFSYLEREEFSAERFKIEIKNLPKYYGIQELRKLINQTLKLNSSKLKQPFKNSRYVFVCFHNDDERDKAIEVLQNTKWKGSQLTAFKAKPTADPYLLSKKRREEQSSDNPEKKIKVETRPVEEVLKEQTTPLSDMPYKEQLQKKQDEIKQILKNLGRQLFKNDHIRDWVRGQQAKYNGLPCELLEVRHADAIDGYRNKCEFTVGRHPQTKETLVGFRVGSYAEGSVGVGPIDDLQIVPADMKHAARLFEQFVRTSAHPPFDAVTQQGVFRQLTARNTRDGQLMLIVGVVPTDLDAAQVDELKQALVAFFFDDDSAGKAAGVSSLYYQPLVKKKSHDDDSNKPVHLHGDTHLVETLLDLQFRISAEAFFQVNTACAEVLYGTAMELAGIAPTCTVVDVCCGTGTIGLCCARRCDQVLGLEIVLQAVEDARRNATLNGITNAEFFSGKAEEILYSVVTRARNDDVLAIIDPPRAGLHKQAITSLRRVDKIGRMVFIACNPRKSCENLVDFARPPSKTIQGVPFVPVKAVMVDMFPHTQHAELVVLLQRFDTVTNVNSPLP